MAALFLKGEDKYFLIICNDNIICNNDTIYNDNVICIGIMKGDSLSCPVSYLGLVITDCQEALLKYGKNPTICAETRAERRIFCCNERKCRSIIYFDDFATLPSERGG